MIAPPKQLTYTRDRHEIELVEQLDEVPPYPQLELARLQAGLELSRAAEKRPGNTAWFNFYHGFVAGLSSCCNPALNHEVVNQEWEAYVAKGLKK